MNNELLEFDDEIKNELKKILKSNKVYFNYTPRHNVNIILEKWNEQDIKIKEVKVDFENYQQWMEQVNYEKNYPKYVKEFSVGKLLNSKSLQHYLSIHLLEIIKKDICLDVASSTSVFPDILAGKYEVKKSYRQDWLYKKGIHGSSIGSSAADIPLPDQSIDKISLHCSWEHFEYDTDRKFIEEAHRIFKKNGKLCIIPLYLAEEYFLITSPTVWSKKYSKVTTEPPKFEKGIIIFIDDEFKQRQAKYYDPKTFTEKILKPYQDIFHLEIIHFVNYKDHLGCPVFALNAAKK